MPKETIGGDEYPTSGNELALSWNKIGWVQARIAPPQTANDGYQIDLTPKRIDRLIKALNKAKRQAYGNGVTWHGFSDVQVDVPVYARLSDDSELNVGTISLDIPVGVSN